MRRARPLKLLLPADPMQCACKIITMPVIVHFNLHAAEAHTIIKVALVAVAIIIILISIH